MAGDLGASAKADQALAVPATPANAVDGPSGFDPSRLVNGPELWCAILATMPSGSIVAGGAVRDYLLGKEPKDIDVFMGAPPVSEGPVEPLDALAAWEPYDPRHGLFRIENTHERYEEYAAVSCILCVSSGTLFGHKVDAVEIEHFQGGPELIKEFDFAITRCWFDGEIRDTPEAKRDRETKTITLLSDARQERSLARFERLNERWGGDWQLVIDALATEAGTAETENTDSVHEGAGLAEATPKGGDL
jgi:hypothetical protein